MIFILSLLIFAVISLAPGGPVGVVAGSASGPPSAQTLAEMRKNLGLDDPMPVQYLRWLGNIFQGNFGKSYVTGEPVADIFIHKLPATFLLMGSAILIALFVSIPIGVIAAHSPNSLLGKSLMIGAIIGVSVPEFWLALMMFNLPGITAGLVSSRSHVHAGERGRNRRSSSPFNSASLRCSDSTYWELVAVHPRVDVRDPGRTLYPHRKS